MRTSFSKLAMAVGIVVPLLTTNAAKAETLRLAGTGGIIEAMRQVAPQFKAVTGIELQVIVGLGTSGAIRAIVDGKIDVVVAGLPLSPELAEGLLVSHPIARTPLVLITSHPKPNGVKAGDIAAIVAAATQNGKTARRSSSFCGPRSTRTRRSSNGRSRL